MDAAWDEVVIGSGPTAWASCEGIWSRGGKPLVIDIGFTSDRRISETVLVRPLVKPKTEFGSDHMYAYPLSQMGVNTTLPSLPLSGGLGGFSSVWGAGIQPVSTHDMCGIPGHIQTAWLKSSEDLLRKMPILGRSDQLDKRDPWPFEPDDEVHLSPRFEKIHTRAVRKADRARTGLAFGVPRLAIKGVKHADRESACVLCLECMTGCPKGSIFNAGVEIKNGLRQFGGKYRAALVENVAVSHETSPDFPVKIRHRLPDGTLRVAVTRSLYVAAGAIGTAVLLQRSELLPKVVSVRDSQMFYAAFLSSEPFDGRSLGMSTSQGYFSTSAEVTGPNEFSMSIYEYSEDFESRVRELLPRNARPIVSLARPLIQRVLPGIGFLAQDVSGSLEISTESGITTIVSRENDLTNRAIVRANRLLTKEARRLKLLRLPNPFSLPSVGAGFHVGASIPMGSSDDKLLDWNGQLKAFPSIRVVDTSALPRIKAGSHTFMAMVNAYRISSDCSR